MRIIDADALQQHFTDMQNYERCACNFTDDGGEPATEWYCVEDALENAHTIDAIPVEWLKKHYYADIRYSNGASYGRRRISVLEALSIWQKEQEART